MNVYNASSKFEGLISSYMQVSEVRIFCFVNKARVLLLFTGICVLYWYKLSQSNVLFVVDYIIYKHIELHVFYLVCH